MLKLLPKLQKRLDRLDEQYSIKKQFVKLKFHDFVTTTVEMLSEDTDPRITARYVSKVSRAESGPCV
jgi:hypothetical protein